MYTYLECYPIVCVCVCVCVCTLPLPVLLAALSHSAFKSSFDLTSVPPGYEQINLKNRSLSEKPPRSKWRFLKRLLHVLLHFIDLWRPYPET
jgi:hypothetical protein